MAFEFVKSDQGFNGMPALYLDYAPYKKGTYFTNPEVITFPDFAKEDMIDMDGKPYQFQVFQLEDDGNFTGDGGDYSTYASWSDFIADRPVFTGNGGVVISPEDEKAIGQFKREVYRLEQLRDNKPKPSGKSHSDEAQKRYDESMKEFRDID